uniref:Uncharacterized protein n=1 Tax=Heterorhabditis bacteriophora TaxID=37862 RepID=A0A1I7W6L6_HETBA
MKIGDEVEMNDYRIVRLNLIIYSNLL